MDTIWWSRVPNTINLIGIIKQQLLSENSVLLQYKEELPWKSTFIDEIKSAVREENSSKSFEHLSGVTDPGKYLLEEYCKAAKRAAYRPSKGYAAFFAESDDIILHEYYFWITIQSKEELKNWCMFISEYSSARGKGKSKAAFVLDCHGITDNSKYKGIRKIDCGELINEYDKKVFATLITARINEDLFLKTYLTELAVNVAGSDVELLAEMISDYRSLLNNPPDTLKRAGANIPEDFTEYAIWKTQIRTIYPFIEEYRRAFVESHYDAISKCLPIETKEGEILYEASEVELGTLVYLTGIQALLLKPVEYEQLVVFKNARNILSHLGVLSWHEIEALQSR